MKRLSVPDLKLLPNIQATDIVTKEFEEAIKSGDWRKVSPLSYFIDCTTLDDAWRDRLSDYCFENGYIAGIDKDEKTGKWIFHTLFCPGGLVSKKEIAKRFEQRESAKQISIEKDIEREFIKYLKQQGKNPRKQVKCAAGRVDIMTSDTVYEVEYRLTRAKLFEALGQVLLYRQSIDPKLKAAIVGQETDETGALVPYINKMGVEVIKWPIQ